MLIYIRKKYIISITPVIFYLFFFFFFFFFPPKDLCEDNCNIKKKLSCSYVGNFFCALIIF